MCGLSVVPSTVGVPVGVNPVAPSSMSQVVPEPFSVHPRSACVAAIDVAERVVGVGQLMILSSISSIAIGGVFATEPSLIQEKTNFQELPA